MIASLFCFNLVLLGAVSTDDIYSIPSLRHVHRRCRTPRDKALDKLLAKYRSLELKGRLPEDVLVKNISQLNMYQVSKNIYKRYALS